MSKLDYQLASEIVIFGALGDLSRRKLLPSLYQLELAGLIHDDSRIIGAARQTHTLEEFKAVVLENLTRFVKEGLDDVTVEKFLSRMVFQQLDFKDSSSFTQLAKTVENKNTTRIYYFSTAPSIYGDICAGLDCANLITDLDRVVMEKPIGDSLESSKVINDQVSAHFNENQIYRIDHYLGKETVLNLLVLRFANSLFTNNWDRNSVDHVQITVAESVGIEGRWGFYDDAGQMRDMVQNHLLQILSLLAM
jgi:glucose-6-phosphate 1-dehydrogenase